MQIPNLPVRGRKVPRIKGGTTGSTKEICETSVLPIPMVPRLHQCHGYIKRKLRAWRVQKCIALVGEDTVLTSAWPQTTTCHWGQYRVHQGNMRNFGPTNTHGTPSAPMQWLYQKEATGMESSKCIALVGADTVLTSVGPQTTPCHGGQYSVHQGNMRNLGPTNTHDTACATMQWLCQKEATGIEISKIYCPSRCRYSTYQCGAANYPVSWGAVQCPPRKYAKLRAYQYPWYRVRINAMFISKGSYGHGEFKNVLP